MSNSIAIILLITGPISTVSSITLVVMVLRSRCKLSNIYHRLMFGISVTDIIISSALSFSTLPAPIGTPNSWKALGTQLTCNAQGFLIMFGFIAGPTYFTSLQFYYMCKIKYQTSSESMIKMEPCLHGAPILLGLAAAILPLVTDSMNPGVKGYCWIQEFPLHCSKDENVECIRGMTAYLMWRFLHSMLLVMTLINGIMMGMVYASVRIQDTRNASHNFELSSPQIDVTRRQGRPCAQQRSSFIRSSEEMRSAQYAKSRKTSKRLMQYSIAYFLTFIFPILHMILLNVQSVDNLLRILSMIFYPLWGLFNLVVFILPAVNKIQEIHSDYSLSRAFVTAIISYEGPPTSNLRARTSMIPKTTNRLRTNKEADSLDINSSHDIESNSG